MYLLTKNKMHHETGTAYPSELEASYETPRVSGFLTAKGSVYTYDNEGKTTRFKTATGEQQERQDLTVFLSLTSEQRQKLLDSIQLETRKVYVIERLPDDRFRKLRDISEVNDPNSVYIGIFKNGEMIGANPASLQPVVGYNVFDTRRYRKGEHWMTERHLGNKVTEITFK